MTDRRAKRCSRRGASIAPAWSSPPRSPLIAVVLVWDARQLATTTMYGMGPEAMPFVIAIGLACSRSAI